MKKGRRRNQLVITALALMIAVAGYLNFSGKEITLLQSAEPQQEASASDSLTVQEVAEGGGDTAQQEALSEDTQENTGDTQEDTGGTQESAAADLREDTVAAAGESVSAEDSDADDMLSSSADDSLEVSDAASDEVAAQESGDDSIISAATQDTIDDTVNAQSNSVSNTILSAQLSKEQSRSKNKEMLMEIVNSKSATKAQKKKATNQILKLSDYMEKESAAQQVLEAKGYKDCMVSMSDDSVDVLVSLSEITDVDRAKIEDVVQRKTGVSINNIVISSLK